MAGRAALAAVVVGSAAGGAAALPIVTEEDTAGTPFEGTTFEVGGLLQYRYNLSARQSFPVEDEGFTNGFEFRRLRYGAEASFFDGLVGLDFQAENARQEFSVLDAGVILKPHERLTLTAGQFRLTFNREVTVSASRPLAVDRSELSSDINPSSGLRTQGIAIEYDDNTYRGTLTIGDGVDSINTSFDTDQDGVAITFRGEVALLGTIEQFSQHTAPRGTPEGLLLGLAVHTEDIDEEEPGSGGERFALTGDLTYQNDGFSAAVIASGHAAEDLNNAGEPEQAYGVVVQAGYYVAEPLELFARYQFGTTSGDELPNFSAVTGGFTWYIYEDAVRFAADASYAFDGVSDVFVDELDGFRENVDGGGQFVLRMQLQVAF